MSERERDAKDDGRELLVTGAGIGAIGIVGLAIGGAVCPVCVVAAPALLGAGLWKRLRARRARPGEGAVSVELRDDAPEGAPK